MTASQNNQHTVMKVAILGLDGEALQDVRLSVSKISRDLDGRKVADVSIILERRNLSGKGWRLDNDFVLGAPALQDNPSASYVGDATVITVDFLTMMHKQVVGYAPVGRFMQLEAPI